MASDDIKRQIVTLWKDPTTGLTGLTRFQQKLKATGIEVTLEDLRSILGSQPSHDLFTHGVRAKKWNTITESGVGHGMQMDLMDMKQIATRNKNYKWILCIIDVYSRYAWAFPVKRKTKKQIHATLEKWLKSLGKKVPFRMTSDAGTEFTSYLVKNLFESHDIKHYVNDVGDKTTTGIVERFNRTLRDLIGRNFSRIGKLHWLHDLPMLVKNYNHSVHSTLAETPDAVWQGKGTPQTRTVVRETFSFKPGDRVRILLPRGIFVKKAWGPTLVEYGVRNCTTRWFQICSQAFARGTTQTSAPPLSSSYGSGTRDNKHYDTCL